MRPGGGEGAGGRAASRRSSGSGGTAAEPGAQGAAGAGSSSSPIAGGPRRGGRSPRAGRAATAAALRPGGSRWAAARVQEFTRPCPAPAGKRGRGAVGRALCVREAAGTGAARWNNAASRPGGAAEHRAPRPAPADSSPRAGGAGRTAPASPFALYFSASQFLAVPGLVKRFPPFKALLWGVRSLLSAQTCLQRFSPTESSVKFREVRKK